MKDLMRKVKSFITFDFPTDNNYLSTHFASTHHHHQKDIPAWSTNATRQKIIAVYWFTHVLQHFVFVIGSASLLIMLISHNFEFSFIGVVIIVGLIIFPIFLLFHYWPTFSYTFLPQLETVKEFYERKQSEQLEKCRQGQLSNPALVLIYYVFDKTSGLNSLDNSNQIASLLMKLYFTRDKLVFFCYQRIGILMRVRI